MKDILNKNWTFTINSGNKEIDDWWNESDNFFSSSFQFSVGDIVNFSLKVFGKDLKNDYGTTRFTVTNKEFVFGPDEPGGEPFGIIYISPVKNY